MDRNETMKEIKAALERRSGKKWSVTDGRGTAWGWITITVPPKARSAFGRISSEAQAELQQLLALDRPVGGQGESIPSSSAYYQEYIDRANGRTPTVKGEPYWD